MHPRNKDKFEYCRIPTWWAAGYEGQGITVAVMEDIDDRDAHGHNCADVIRQIAPKSKVVGRPRPLIEIRGGKYTPETLERLRNYYLALSSEKVDIMSLSVVSGSTPELEALDREILPRVTKFAAAGNDDGTTIDETANAYRETWLAVGAATLYRGKPWRVHYSQVGPTLDCMGFTNLDLTTGGVFTGTSCATPFVAGMFALVQSAALQTLGRLLTPDEGAAFIKAHCEDLEEPGFDETTGFGLFRLPANIPDFRIYEEALAMAFIDVPDSRWSKSLIDQAASRGLMNGYPDGTFRPGQPVTREELAAVAVRLYERAEERYQELRSVLKRAGIAV